MNNSTTIRKKGRPKLDIKGDILKCIRDSVNPLSTSDLCLKTDKAWHTIDRACLMLQLEGKLDGFRVGKMNLWRLK